MSSLAPKGFFSVGDPSVLKKEKPQVGQTQREEKALIQFREYKLGMLNDAKLQPYVYCSKDGTQDIAFHTPQQVLEHPELGLTDHPILISTQDIGGFSLKIVSLNMSGSAACDGCLGTLKDSLSERELANVQAVRKENMLALFKKLEDEEKPHLYLLQESWIKDPYFTEFLKKLDSINYPDGCLNVLFRGGIFSSISSDRNSLKSGGFELAVTLTLGEEKQKITCYNADLRHDRRPLEEKQYHIRCKLGSSTHIVLYGGSLGSETGDPFSQIVPNQLRSGLPDVASTDAIYRCDPADAKQGSGPVISKCKYRLISTSRYLDLGADLLPEFKELKYSEAQEKELTVPRQFMMIADEDYNRKISRGELETVSYLNQWLFTFTRSTAVSFGLARDPLGKKECVQLLFPFQIQSIYHRDWEIAKIKALYENLKNLPIEGGITYYDDQENCQHHINLDLEKESAMAALEYRLNHINSLCIFQYQESWYNSLGFGGISLALSSNDQLVTLGFVGNTEAIQGFFQGLQRKLGVIASENKVFESAQEGLTLVIYTDDLGKVDEAIKEICTPPEMLSRRGKIILATFLSALIVDAAIFGVAAGLGGISIKTAFTGAAVLVVLGGNPLIGGIILGGAALLAGVMVLAFSAWRIRANAAALKVKQVEKNENNENNESLNLNLNLGRRASLSLESLSSSSGELADFSNKNSRLRGLC